MLSRSHLLIERELTHSLKANLWGISVALVNDNLYEWSAKINGPKETPWQGGIFRLYLKFDENFSTQPPRICFHTIPYHPNIDIITGRPCIDFLDDWNLWKENTKIIMMLLQIQNLLGNPVLEKAINMEAAIMIRNSPLAYTKIVMECVTCSKQIEEGEQSGVPHQQYSLPSIPGVVKKETESDSGYTHKARGVTKLSFDSYLAHWSGLATSKPQDQCHNTYLEALRDDPKLKKVHYGKTEEQMVAEEMAKQDDYGQVYYGNIRSEKSAEKQRDVKLARLNQMKNIYLPKKTPITTTPRSPQLTSDSEQEADDLVAWTKRLNVTELDTL